MTAYMNDNDALFAPSASNAPKSWLIVTQYKSDRVVYFTDDHDFDIPGNADWCYVCPHEGELPQGMTLRNCWNWRYRGMTFIDERKPRAPDPVKALLEQNQETLRKLLREKIDALRKPVSPSCSQGAYVRERRLEEAMAVQRGAVEPGVLKFLPGSAAVHGVTLEEMADRVVQAHERYVAVLAETEILREEILQAIDASTAQDELARVRQRLMETVSPETGAASALRPEHTTPERKAALPKAAELHQEQLRLQVQLRLRINELRRLFASEYVLDDVVLRHKGRLAELVLKGGGAVPAGVDASALLSHAAARGLSLVDAAKDVLTEMNDVARHLLSTEQQKEADLQPATRTTAIEKNPRNREEARCARADSQTSKSSGSSSMPTLA